MSIFSWKIESLVCLNNAQVLGGIVSRQEDGTCRRMGHV